MKRLKQEGQIEGFPHNDLREILVLKQLFHQNVVNLRYIWEGDYGQSTSTIKPSKNPRGDVHVVFDYLDHDFTGLMDTPGVEFTEDQVKNYVWQIFNGLAYCHAQGVLHRDIKGANLLVDNDGNLKIADFGLSRIVGERGRHYTNKVVTLWYRAPELLLGETLYGPSIDMWSVGCLLAEMLTRKPLFPGDGEVKQSHLIFNMLGIPSTEDEWPGFWELPGTETLKTDGKHGDLAKHLRKDGCSEGAINLIQHLLMLDPEKRITAEKAMDHQWFRDEPKMCRKNELPKFAESAHEWEAKQRRDENRKKRAAEEREEEEEARRSSKRQQQEDATPPPAGTTPMPGEHSS